MPRGAQTESVWHTQPAGFPHIRAGFGSPLTQFLHCLNLVTAHAAARLLLHELSPLKLLAFHTIPVEVEGGTMSFSMLSSGNCRTFQYQVVEITAVPTLPGCR